MWYILDRVVRGWWWGVSWVWNNFCERRTTVALIPTSVERLVRLGTGWSTIWSTEWLVHQLVKNTSEQKSWSAEREDQYLKHRVGFDKRYIRVTSSYQELQLLCQNNESKQTKRCRESGDLSVIDKLLLFLADVSEPAECIGEKGTRSDKWQSKHRLGNLQRML